MQKRKSAKYIEINEINSSTYVKRPGFEPSGILTRYGEVSRVNIIGLIVGKEKETLVIDDGTGTIQIRSFDSVINFDDFNLGDMVNIIGRPRENGFSKYIAPEIIKKVDKQWFKVRQLEIKHQKKKALPLPVEPNEQEEQVEIGPYQTILNVIAILDKGEGAEINDIINNVKIKDAEKIISDLLEEGEIFEISPGKVKIL